MGSLRSAYATVTGRGSSSAVQRRDAARGPVAATAPQGAPPGGTAPAADAAQGPVQVPAQAVELPVHGAELPCRTAEFTGRSGEPAAAPPDPHAASDATASSVATAAPARTAAPAPPVPLDLRGTAARRTLVFPTGDRVVVSGLPGSGKSTLIRRVLALQSTVRRIDSQDVRESWAAALPRWLPYAAYRPLVRLAHYAGLHRALASGASVVVHDCGSQAWVRTWLGRDALRRGRALHLVLLDVAPATALRSQAERGRAVSRYAFARHRAAVRRLIADAESGSVPLGCESVVLLDRGAAGALAGMAFE